MFYIFRLFKFQNSHFLSDTRFHKIYSLEKSKYYQNFGRYIRRKLRSTKNEVEVWKYCATSEYLML